MLRNIHTVRIGRGLILWYEISTEKEIRIGTWNFSSLYGAGSLTAAARKLARYKLDLVGVQEVRWDKWAQNDQVKVKVKCTLVQALRLCKSRTAHRGSRVIALHFHDHGTRRR